MVDGRCISIKPLTSSDFAGYGEVIEQAVEGAIAVFAFHNERSAARFDLIAARPSPLFLPLVVDRLERHPHSSQAFIPLDATDYLVVVAQDGVDGQPDIASLRTFRAAPSQGVCFAPGVWHRAVAALENSGSFATITYYEGTEQDLVYAAIPAITIVSDLPW